MENTFMYDELEEYLEYSDLTREDVEAKLKDGHLTIIDNVGKAYNELYAYLDNASDKKLRDFIDIVINISLRELQNYGVDTIKEYLVCKSGNYFLLSTGRVVQYIPF